MMPSLYGSAADQTKSSLYPPSAVRVAIGNKKNRSMNTCRVLSLFLIVMAWATLDAQTVTTFEGMDASQLTNPGFDIDPNGAVGTRQFMEWVNVAYQAYDKITFAPV